MNGFGHKRGIYLLPNLVTCLNLAAGFYSIISSINLLYGQAAWAIVVAIALDILDGRVARWTGGVSPFGMEYDSIADMVSFCLAPAILMYQVALYDLHEWGFVVALAYALFGGMRLARFNTRAVSGASSEYFQGLPTPAAAGILSALVLMFIVYGELGLGPGRPAKTIGLLRDRMPLLERSIPILMVMLAGLMVSRIRYATFKNLNLRRPKPFRFFVMIVAAALVIWRYPESAILALFSLYILSGLTGIVWRTYRLRRQRGGHEWPTTA